MKNIIRGIFFIVGITYFLFIPNLWGDQIAILLLFIVALDRGAAWFDRNVPFTDPRKHK